MTCRNRWDSENKCGENNPAWLGGINSLPYGPEFNGTLKKRIRARDDNSCALCGESAKEVHHINYDKANSQMNNLITLCSSCHGKTIHNRTSYQAILSDMVSDKLFNGFMEI